MEQQKTSLTVDEITEAHELLEELTNVRRFTSEFTGEDAVPHKYAFEVGLRNRHAGAYVKSIQLPQEDIEQAMKLAELRIINRLVALGLDEEDLERVK